MRKKILWLLATFCMVWVSHVGAQTNEWMVQYTTFDDPDNGTGDRTASVAVIGKDTFVALVTRLEGGELFSNLRNNYLVGYIQADSAKGRVAAQEYGPTGVFTTWASALDEVDLNGAWQIAAGQDSLIYVANNDPNHNILVFRLTEAGVVSTDFRMETGAENIFAIDVDTAGYVYVADYEGTDAKNNEIKVYAPIGAPNTTWEVIGGHTDPPVAVIDLPPGIYQGLTVSEDGSRIFVSATSERKLMRFSGDPVNGYSLDDGFNVALAADDTVGNGGFGTPSFLGLAYYDPLNLVFAAVDTFLHGGATGGYPYGRVYVIDGVDGVVADTLDVAEWNFRITGSYDTGSSVGNAGGFTSVYDVDVSDEPAVYLQTYYGWAVEKWVFNGDLGAVVSVQPLPSGGPDDYALQQNYPNPFNPETTIEFSLRKAGPVRLTLYNVIGQKIAVLVDQHLSAGHYKVNFNGEKLPTGIYFYTLEAGQFKTTKKMLLAR